MLALIVVAIMMGFPTAFTLMGLGMVFGYIAFWAPAQHWYDNRIFDLIVQRTYGVMTNDTLLSIPPSVMLIVYAAVAGQSIVKLYAAAMLPGFFLTFLYLVYILGWAIINPKIAPKLRPDQYRVAVPDWLRQLERGRSRSVVPGLLAAAFRPGAVAYGAIGRRVLVLSVPLMLTVGTLAATWWYVVVYNAPEAAATAAAPAPSAPGTAAVATAPASPKGPRPAVTEEKLQELGAVADSDRPQELGSAGETEPVRPPPKVEGPLEEMTSLRDPTAASGAGKIPEHFYAWFWGLAAFSGLLLLVYFWRMDGEQLEILKELCASVVPLGVLTVVVLAVILFGITTATESAAIGALGTMYLAVMAKYAR